MGTWFKTCLFLFACIVGIGIASPVPALAAPQSGTSSMVITVEIADPDVFWNSTYYQKDTTPRKPASVSLEWGMANKPSTTGATIIPLKKDKGEYKITSEKGAVIDFDLIIKDEKGRKIVNWGMQLQNNGQTETITITPPPSNSPDFARG